MKYFSLDTIALFTNFLEHLALPGLYALPYFTIDNFVYTLFSNCISCRAFIATRLFCLDGLISCVTDVSIALFLFHPKTLQVTFSLHTKLNLSVFQTATSNDLVTDVLTTMSINRRNAERYYFNVLCSDITWDGGALENQYRSLTYRFVCIE